VKNLLAVTLLSLGVPMLLMGDEMRRTQLGNNNAYCQDNETSWLDWSLLARHADVHRFVSLLNARRLLRDSEHERHRATLHELIEGANKTWHGVKLHQPDWRDFSHTLALTAEMWRERLLVHLILNAYREPLDFELPPLDRGTAWCRWIDTSLDSPDDIVQWQTAPSVSDRAYRVGAHSMVLLIAAGSGPASGDDEQ
jgi:glycogen operon protein